MLGLDATAAAAAVLAVTTNQLAHAIRLVMRREISPARMLSSPRPPPANISWCDRVIAACPSAISCAPVMS